MGGGFFLPCILFQVRIIGILLCSLHLILNFKRGVGQFSGAIPVIKFPWGFCR